MPETLLSAKPMATLGRLSPVTRRAGLLLLVASLSHWLALPATSLAYHLVSLVMALLAPWLLPRLSRRLLLSGLFVAAVAGLTLLLPTDMTGAAVGVLLLGAWYRLIESQESRSLRAVMLMAIILMALALIGVRSSLVLLALLPFTWLMIELLLELSVGEAPVPRRARLRLASQLLALALPTALMLFLFFPRLSGSLLDIGFAVGLPIFVETQAEKEQPALSMSLEAGDLAERTRGDGRVMIVEFAEHSKAPYHDGPPPLWRLYWRGPVYWRYDGSVWHVREGWESRSVQMRGRFRAKSWKRTVKNKWRIADYEVNLFPHQDVWLYALDLPERIAPSSFLTRDFQLINLNPVLEPLRYRLTSFLFYDVTQPLPEAERAMALALPEGENPRLTALAQTLLEEAEDPRDLVNRALTRFTEGYNYTRNYETLDGRHQMDRFYFDSKSGHAAHFAGSFVLLMRAAGIPARLIGGYRGGSFMDLTNIVTVKESHAYAWAEVWLEDVGGWVRVDPARPLSLPGWDAFGNGFDLQAGAADPEEDAQTAALAAADAATKQMERPASEQPSRETTEQSEGASGAAASSFDFFAATDRLWQDWIVGFGARDQIEMYHELDLGRATWKKLLLLAGSGLLILASLYVCATLGLDLLRGRIRRRGEDPVTTQYRAFCAMLARRKLGRLPYEGPRAYARRLNDTLGGESETARLSNEMIELYIDLRYGIAGEDYTALAEAFKQRVRRFRPAR